MDCGHAPTLPRTIYHLPTKQADYLYRLVDLHSEDCQLTFLGLPVAHFNVSVGNIFFLSRSTIIMSTYFIYTAIFNKSS